MEKSDLIDFLALEKELKTALEADKKYQRENDAKFRAIHQKVASYEEFRDIVLASHLKPLEKKDITAPRKQPWNSVSVGYKEQKGASPDIPLQSDFQPRTGSEFIRDWRRFGGSSKEKYGLLVKLGVGDLARADSRSQARAGGRAEFPELHLNSLALTMKDYKDAEEIAKILEEAPTARKALLDNYNNLCGVAEYCEKNYVQAGGDANKALEETKAFTTQSLASVAYQISTLATNVLKLLEAQSSQLRRIESSVHLIGLTVDMHREKVARREIGVFTMTKRFSRSNKVISPTGDKEPKPKYTRTPISYSSLDCLGHGMKDAKPQERKASMIRKQGGTLGRNSRTTEPVQCPVAPSLSHGASQTSLSDKHNTSSFGKAVPSPVIPSWPTNPDADIVSTLLQEGPPAPPLLCEVEQEPKLNTPPAPPPPPLDPCDLLPPPPMPPAEETFEASNLGGIVPPPPAPPLETVPEEISLPLPESPSECFPPPLIDGLQLPAPPPLCGEELGDGMEVLLQARPLSARLAVPVVRGRDSTHPAPAPCL